MGRWRRGRDSNSWFLAESLVFKTSSLNHSDTSPCLTLVYDITSLHKSQRFFFVKIFLACSSKESSRHSSHRAMAGREIPIHKKE